MASNHQHLLISLCQLKMHVSVERVKEMPHDGRKICPHNKRVIIMQQQQWQTEQQQQQLLRNHHQNHNHKKLHLEVGLQEGQSTRLHHHLVGSVWILVSLEPHRNWLLNVGTQNVINKLRFLKGRKTTRAAIIVATYIVQENVAGHTGRNIGKLVFTLVYLTCVEKFWRRVRMTLTRYVI